MTVRPLAKPFEIVFTRVRQWSDIVARPWLPRVQPPTDACGDGSEILAAHNAVCSLRLTAYQ
jgi:hypothetical protein